MRRRDFLSAIFAAALTAQSAYSADRRLVVLGGPANQLKRWQAALTAQKSGVRNAKFVTLGDSTTAGWGGSFIAAQSNGILDSYPAQIARLIPGASISSCFADRNTLIGSPGTVTLAAFDPRFVLGSWTQALGNTKTLGGPMLVCTAGTTPLAFTPLNPVDTFVVYYRTTPGAGSFTAQIGAGGTTTLDQNAANSLQVSTITGTLGINTLNLARVAGNCDLVGVYAYDSSTKEVSVINAGWSGSLVGDWTASVANVWDPLPVLQSVAPDLTIISLTVNDWNAGTSLATYSANLQTIITAAKVSGDVILVSGIPTNPTGHASIATQQTYIDAVSVLASANGCPFLSMTARWTDWATKQALGWYFDDLHADAIGYADVATAVFGKLKTGSGLRSSGLVGYLPFDTANFNFGGNLVAEQSGGNAIRCTLTNLAAPAVVTGQIAQGLTYDGVTDSYVSFPANFFDGLAQGSISAWVNLPSFAPNASAICIFGGASASAVTGLFSLQLFGNTATDTRLRLGAKLNGDVLMGNTSISLSAFHHVVATSDGLTTKLYVDGVLQTLTVASGSNTGKWFASSVQGAMRWTVGNLRRSSGDIFLMKGVVDDFRVYSVPLAQADVTNIYQQGLLGIAAGL